MRLAWWLMAASATLACDDGEKTDPTPSPPPWRAALDPGADGALLSVWGDGTDAVWTVGGQPDAGAAWRRGDAEWVPVEIPDGPLLNWVHGVDGEVWMVGNEGRALRSVGGGPFTATDTGTHLPLWGVWAAAADDVWAVGGDAAQTTDPEPALLRWDGEAWSPVALPEVDRGLPALFKVWGSSASNVFAVGSNGVALRYDGSAWTQTLTGSGRDLISLWGRAADEIVAVGGRDVGVVARWDGAGWTSETLRSPGLNGIWMDGEGVATFVGDRGHVYRMEPNGEPVREPTEVGELLHGVWGDGAGFRVAVGGSLMRSPPWTGVAIESGE